MKKIFKSLMSVLTVFALLFAASCGGADKQNQKPAGNDGKAASQESDTFTVGMECGYAPYNWSQADDANGAVQIKGSQEYAYGYDVIIAKKIAESMGKTLVVQKIDWDGLPLALQAGNIDAVIAGQSITSERLKTVDFSKPYYFASVVAMTKTGSKYENAKSIAELAGAAVTSQINTIWYDVCLPQIPDAKILPAQESAPQMLVALDAGKADVIVCDMPTALAAQAVYKDFKILDFGKTDGDFKVSDEDINIGISVKKGNSALLKEINKVLDTMSPDDYTKLMQEAISVQPLNS